MHDVFGIKAQFRGMHAIHIEPHRRIVHILRNVSLAYPWHSADLIRQFRGRLLA